MSDRGGAHAQASRAKSWVLMRADRRVLSVVLLAVVFLALVGVGVTWPASVRGALRSGDPIETLFQAMVTTIITGVTLVVSINQLVLAQELGSVGDQQSRMDGSLTFRSEAASHVDEAVSPADPAAFLGAVLSTVGDRARRLERGATGAGAEEVASFAAAVATSADRAGGRLAGAEFGSFEVIGAALTFDYSVGMYEGRRLRETRAASVTADGRRTLDELLEALELFGVAREHFKTLYFQWELIAFSRVLLYTAVPALATAVAMILFFPGPAGVPGTTLGVENVLWVVTGATLASVSPFAVLISYMLRIVTVAQRTLAIGAFVLRKTDDGLAVDGE